MSPKTCPNAALYQTNASPPSRAVLMVIDKLGIDVQLKDLNPLLREQDTPELIQKNPMKTIPLYEEGEYALADSHAIMIYLMEKYGTKEHSSLYPTDLRKRATVLQRMFFDCGILFPSLQIVMAGTYTGRLGGLSDTMVRRIERAYGMLEVYLSQTQYVADDVMTIADLSILTTMTTLDGLCPVDEKRFPKLKQWLGIMNEKDVCKRINKAGSDEHISGLKGFMLNNKYNLKSKI